MKPSSKKKNKQPKPDYVDGKFGIEYDPVRKSIRVKPGFTLTLEDIYKYLWEEHRITPLQFGE